MTNTLNLCPNRNLVDNYFDRYILANEQFQAASLKLPNKALYKTPSAEQFGIQHLKTFNAVDRLVVDQFVDEKESIACYVVLNNFSIICTHFQVQDSIWSHPVEVVQLNVPDEVNSCENSYPPSLCFIDENYASVSDGCGIVELYWTGNREAVSSWKLVFKIANELTSSSIIVDARSHHRQDSSDDSWKAEILLQTVEKDASADKSKTSFLTHITWISIEQKADGSYQVTRTRMLTASEYTEFVTLDNTGRRVFIAGGARPKFLADSLRPIAEAEVLEEEKAEEIARREKSREAETTLLSDVGTKDATVGKESGTSATMEDAPPTFNSEQLEECDQSGDILLGFLIDGDSHELLKTVDMTGNSVIFTRRLRGGAPLSFALRHDVHGVVWDFKEKCADGDASDEALFDHKFTLHAFGFIQAGHNEKQFTGCSPSGEYAVIVNRRNHVFVYFQNAAVDKDFELKNRRAGGGGARSTVAKQVIFALAKADPMCDLSGTDSEYIGFYAGESVLLLLTHSSVVAVRINGRFGI